MSTDKCTNLHFFFFLVIYTQIINNHKEILVGIYPQLRMPMYRTLYHKRQMQVIKEQEVKMCTPAPSLPFQQF